MATKLRRRLYQRGSSFETTIPMPMLFAVDKEKKQDVVFTYDAKDHRWYVDVEPRK
tara:strand:+ start:444 stop:611 length:168 start_codon:yes stop_codon:yes gene_type:complete